MHPSSQRHKKEIALITVEILVGTLHTDAHVEEFLLFNFFTQHVALFHHFGSWSVKGG